LRRAKIISELDENDSKGKTRRFNLEAKAYEAYANDIITKDQCDDIFDVLEGK
jgi:hypothetical protein